MMMHYKLAKWWSNTAEIRSSCTRGLGPWTYHQSAQRSDCPSVGLFAFCRLHVGLLSPRGNKSRPPQTGSLFDGRLSTSPHTAALPSGTSSINMFFLYSLFVHTHTVSSFVAQAHQYMRSGRNNTANTRSKHQRTEGFHWCTPKHLQGRLIWFRLEMKAPHHVMIKSVQRAVHINNGYLLCLVFFSCAQRDNQAVESFLSLAGRTTAFLQVNTHYIWFQLFRENKGWRK